MLTKRELTELVRAARDTRQDLSAANAALNRLVAEFQDYAVGSAYSWLRDFAAAQDAAQDAFVAAWRALPQLKDAALFPAWFKRILANQCSRATRRTNRSSENVDVDSLL